MKRTGYILICLLGICIGLLIGQKTSGRGEKETIPQEPMVITDTITTVEIDTVVVVKPIVQRVEVLKNDTIFVRDTIFIELPIERKIYQDSTYKASVTGYRAELEEIEVYPQTVTNTVVQSETIYKYIPKKWGFGLSVGYGVTTADWKLSPYVGISVNYNLFSW